MVSAQNDRMAGSVPVWESAPRFAENIAGQTDLPDQKNSFGLPDVIDIINPLQHIPVISHLYQRMTGDTIGSIAEIVGGALFGGPVGLVTSAGMVAYEKATEKGSEEIPVVANSSIDQTSYNV